MMMFKKKSQNPRSSYFLTYPTIIPSEKRIYMQYLGLLQLQCFKKNQQRMFKKKYDKGIFLLPTYILGKGKVKCDIVPHLTFSKSLILFFVQKTNILPHSSKTRMKNNCNYKGMNNLSKYNWNGVIYLSFGHKFQCET